MNYLDPPASDVQRLVGLALQEDLQPLGDLSASLIDGSLKARASFVARDAGVLAGSACVEEVVKQVSPTLQVLWAVDEGESFQANTVLANLEGPLREIVTAERTCLNFLSHLSGIATRVSTWVKVADGRVQVWDTRKTLPGYRSLQKAAVRAGGGRNHRANLSDWIMLKDNHLTGLDITSAVRRARNLWPGRTVEVEADDLAQAKEALVAAVDIIMLDNFSPSEAKEALVELRELAKFRSAAMPLIEVSGGVTLDNLESYAQIGVDLVSSSRLTSGTNPIDIGLDIETGL